MIQVLSSARYVYSINDGFIESRKKEREFGVNPAPADGLLKKFQYIGCGPIERSIQLFLAGRSIRNKVAR
jgi:hypothetical protein